MAGICVCDSEKIWKRFQARRERTRVRRLLHMGESEFAPYLNHPRHGQWRWGKDGKRFFDPSDPREAKALRK